jgi:hypothetical protein
MNRLNKFYNPKLYKAPPKRVLSEEDQITVNMGGTLAPTAAPGGLGVFEATLLLRLGGGVAEAPLLAVVLSYRLVSTLADVVAVGSFSADRSIAGWLAQRN